MRSYRDRLKPISVADVVDYSEGEPEVTSGVSFGEFELVGHGFVTSPTCGVFSGYFSGCDRTELHDKVTLDMASHRGKVEVAHAIFHSCDRPSCPVCYSFGWARREANRIATRLAIASQRGMGKVEHLMISVPVRDYYMDMKALRAKVIRLLRVRGIGGGALILHGFRYANFDEARRKNLPFGWRWSVHWHVLGYVLGGYFACRTCARKSNCDPRCDGVDSRLWKAYKADGYYCRVFGERVSVYKTVRYLLSHATVKKGSVRWHCITWFGNVSYHKLKISVEEHDAFVHKSRCIICGEPLVKLRYTGSRLDTFVLIYGGRCSVPLKEETDWALEMPEVVWERYVPSVSHRYNSENY